MLLDHPQSLPYLSAAGLLTTVALAAWTDWNAWRIPNKLLAASLASALMLAAFAPFSIGIGDALLGGLIGLIAFLPVYLLRGMGAGDVKLMAVVGVWTGPWQAFNTILVSALIGGAWAVLLWDMNRGGVTLWLKAKYAGLPRSSASSKDTCLGSSRIREQVDRQKIPYGVVIAIGTWLTIGIQLLGTR